MIAGNDNPQLCSEIYIVQGLEGRLALLPTLDAKVGLMETDLFKLSRTQELSHGNESYHWYVCCRSHIP